MQVATHILSGETSEKMSIMSLGFGSALSSCSDWMAQMSDSSWGTTSPCSVAYLALQKRSPVRAQVRNGHNVRSQARCRNWHPHTAVQTAPKSSSRVLVIESRQSQPSFYCPKTPETRNPQQIIHGQMHLQRCQKFSRTFRLCGSLFPPRLVPHVL